MNIPFIRAPYNYDQDQTSKETGLACPEEESKTQQQFKDECDINTIVKRFGLTGELPPDFRAPQSGDFTGLTDYHSMMTAVREADEAFMQMPAELRTRFSNDPAKLIDFVSNDANRAEAENLGLVPKPPEQPRQDPQPKGNTP